LKEGAASGEARNPELLSKYGIQMDEHRWCCGACLDDILEKARDHALGAMVGQLHAAVLKACYGALKAASVMNRDEEMQHALKEILEQVATELGQ